MCVFLLVLWTTEMSTSGIVSGGGGRGGRCVEVTTLPPSCADFLEILIASTSWSPKALARSLMGLNKI